jgi:hypothetical protein
MARPLCGMGRDGENRKGCRKKEMIRRKKRRYTEEY